MLLSYRGYVGHADFNREHRVFVGQLETEECIPYYGRTIAEVKQCFRDSIDSYLDHCMEEEIVPEQEKMTEVSVVIPECMTDKSVMSLANLLNLVNSVIDMS